VGMPFFCVRNRPGGRAGGLGSTGLVPGGGARVGLMTWADAPAEEAGATVSPRLTHVPIEGNLFSWWYWKSYTS
jgi:hypothetical protein